MQQLFAHHSAVIHQLGSHVAQGLTGGEQAVLDGAHGSVGQLPYCVSRDVCGVAAGVNAGSGQGHGSAGCHIVITGLHNSVVEDAGGSSLGHDDDGVDGGTLGAVGGNGTHDVLGGALTLGNEGGGAAAVTVDSVDAAQGQHHFAHLVVGQAGGGGGVTAVHLAEDQGAVFLDADHGTGSIGRGTLDGLALQNAVLDQPAKVGGDGGPLVAIQRSGHGAQLSGAILVDSQVGLRALVDLGGTQDHALPDHVAVGSVGVVGQGGVHGANHVVAQGILIVGHSLGQFLGLPDGGVAGQVIGIQLVDAIVAGEDFNGLVGCVNLENMDDLTVGAAGVVQDDLLFNSAGGQIVGVAGDHIVISIGHRGVEVSGGRLGSQDVHGQQANDHQDSQKQGQTTDLL